MLAASANYASRGYGYGRRTAETTDLEGRAPVTRSEREYARGVGQLRVKGVRVRPEDGGDDRLRRTSASHTQREGICSRRQPIALGGTAVRAGLKPLIIYTCQIYLWNIVVHIRRPPLTWNRWRMWRRRSLRSAGVPWVLSRSRINSALICGSERPVRFSRACSSTSTCEDVGV